MRSTMLSSSRRTPKRYKGEDDDFEDEDFEDEVDEVTFPEFKLGGKNSNPILYCRTWASGEETSPARSARGRSSRTGD